jgi:DNA ligase-4
LVKASEDVQSGRYYNKTLEQLDQISSVRDPGRPIPTEHEGDDEDEEEEVQEEGTDEVDERQEACEPSQARGDVVKGSAKSDRQQALEAEWGLYRSPAVSQQSPEEEDGDTDGGRNHDSPDVDDEDFMVSQEF